MTGQSRTQSGTFDHGCCLLLLAHKRSFKLKCKRNKIRISLVFLPLQALLSLLEVQRVHAVQHLQVYLVGRHHHEYPLAHLYQQRQRDQQGQGCPVMKKKNKVKG